MWLAHVDQRFDTQCKLLRLVRMPALKVLLSDSKHILRFLSGTMQVGIEYSPDIERDFMNTYSEVLRAAGKDAGFSDLEY